MFTINCTSISQNLRFTNLYSFSLCRQLVQWTLWCRPRFKAKLSPWLYSEKTSVLALLLELVSQFANAWNTHSESELYSWQSILLETSHQLFVEKRRWRHFKFRQGRKTPTGKTHTVSKAPVWVSIRVLFVNKGQLKGIWNKLQWIVCRLLSLKLHLFLY